MSDGSRTTVLTPQQQKLQRNTVLFRPASVKQKIIKIQHILLHFILFCAFKGCGPCNVSKASKIMARFISCALPWWSTHSYSEDGREQHLYCRDFLRENQLRYSSRSPLLFWFDLWSKVHFCGHRAIRHLTDLRGLWPVTISLYDLQLSCLSRSKNCSKTLGQTWFTLCWRACVGMV